MIVELYSRCEVKESKGKDWIFNGYVNFQLEVDDDFILSAQEDIINEVFYDLVSNYKRKHYRYFYENYEIMFKSSIKLKADVKKLYDKKIKSKLRNYDN